MTPVQLVFLFHRTSFSRSSALLVVVYSVDIRTEDNESAAVGISSAWPHSVVEKSLRTPQEAFAVPRLRGFRGWPPEGGTPNPPNQLSAPYRAATIGAVAADWRQLACFRNREHQQLLHDAHDHLDAGGDAELAKQAVQVRMNRML